MEEIDWIVNENCLDDVKCWGRGSQKTLCMPVVSAWYSLLRCGWINDRADCVVIWFESWIWRDCHARAHGSHPHELLSHRLTTHHDGGQNTPNGCPSLLPTLTTLCWWMNKAVYRTGYVQPNLQTVRNTNYLTVISMGWVSSSLKWSNGCRGRIFSDLGNLTYSAQRFIFRRLHNRNQVCWNGCQISFAVYHTQKKRRRRKKKTIQYFILSTPWKCREKRTSHMVFCAFYFLNPNGKV